MEAAGFWSARRQDPQQKTQHSVAVKMPAAAVARSTSPCILLSQQLISRDDAAGGMAWLHSPSSVTAIPFCLKLRIKHGIYGNQDFSPNSLPSVEHEL